MFVYEIFWQAEINQNTFYETWASGSFTFFIYIFCCMFVILIYSARPGRMHIHMIKFVSEELVFD